jgi:type IV pilus assembly protein PilQ
MAKAGNVTRIASLEKFRQAREGELASKRGKEKLADLRIDLIHVKYTSARDMVPVVKNFLGERETVSADERTNTLILSDISTNIKVMRDLFR